MKPHRRIVAVLLLAITVILATGDTVSAQVAGPTPPATMGPPAPPSTQPAPAGPDQPGPIVPGGVPGSVLAPDAASEAPPPTPEAPGDGTSSLLRGPDLRNGEAPTLYEKYGSAGYDLDSDLGWRDLSDSVGHIAVTVIWGMTRWIADASIKIFQWSYSLDLFGMTGGAIADVTASLNRILYQPFVLPMVILVGLWLTWNALIKKRAALAAESSIWVIFALAAAVVFMAQPARIVGGLNGATTGLSRSILNGVAGLDPKTGPADGVQTRGTYGGDRTNAELRAVADRMWRTYIYAPWTVLEFGTTTKAPQWGERLLNAKTITDDDTTAIKNGAKTADTVDREKKDDYAAIREQIKKDPQARAYFQGHRPGQRISTAGLALAGVLVSGGLLAGLALATLFAQLALLLLAMLAPIFLLAAIHPGVGRVIATRWGNLLVYTAFKRVAYSVLLSVILVVNGALIDQGSKLGWGVAMTLSVALSGALFFYRKPFLSIVERVRVGRGSHRARTERQPRHQRTHRSPGRHRRRHRRRSHRSGGRRQSRPVHHPQIQPTRRRQHPFERQQDAAWSGTSRRWPDELGARRQARRWRRVQDHQGGRRYRGRSAPLTPQDGEPNRRTRRGHQPLRHPQRCTPWPELNIASAPRSSPSFWSCLWHVAAGEGLRRRRSGSVGVKPSRRATTRRLGSSKAPTFGHRPGKPSISPPGRRTGSVSRSARNGLPSRSRRSGRRATRTTPATSGSTSR